MARADSFGDYAKLFGATLIDSAPGNLGSGVVDRWYNDATTNSNAGGNTMGAVNTSSSPAPAQAPGEVRIASGSGRQPGYTYWTDTQEGQNYNPGPSAEEIAQQKAQAEKERHQANIMKQIQSGKQNVDTTAKESAQSKFNTQRGSILDFISNAQLSQQDIDQQRKNAALSKIQGDQDIMSMINRGINSGNVMLANRNAVSSGAAGEIARAYGELGNREARGLSNQFELANQDIDTTQTNLFKGFDEQERKTEEFKIEAADTIAQTARQDIAALNEQAIGADLGTQFEIEQEKQRIRAMAMSKLGELDSILSAERAKFNPLDRSGAITAARGMSGAGQNVPQQFDLNTRTAPINAQQRSIAGANVPIFSNIFNRRREV